MNEPAEVKPVLPVHKVIILLQELFLKKLHKVQKESGLDEFKSGEPDTELFADEEHEVIVDYKICI